MEQPETAAPFVRQYDILTVLSGINALANLLTFLLTPLFDSEQTSQFLLIIE